MNQVCTISCATPPKCHCAQVYHLCQSALRGDGLPCSVTEVGAYVGQTYGVVIFHKFVKLFPASSNTHLCNDQCVIWHGKLVQCVEDPRVTANNYKSTASRSKNASTQAPHARTERRTTRKHNAPGSTYRDGVKCSKGSLKATQQTVNYK